MRLFLPLLLVLLTPLAVHAQATVAPLSLTGEFGLGQVVNRARGMGGVTMNTDLHYRRHALGIHIRYHQRGFILSSVNLWEVGGVYSYNVVEGLSLGTGLSYVSEVHRPAGHYDLVYGTRWGVPLEVTYRFAPKREVGTFLRAHVTFSRTQIFGGLGLGVTL